MCVCVCVCVCEMKRTHVDADHFYIALFSTLKQTHCITYPCLCKRSGLLRDGVA